MSCVTISGMAARTPVPETAMKFVNGIGLGIIAVHKVAVRHSRHTLLAPVSHMLNSVWTGILLDKALFFKIQPLQSFDRLIDIGPAPSLERFHGNGVFFEAVFSPVQVARTSNGDTFGKGVEVGVSFKFFFKLRNLLVTTPRLIYNNLPFLWQNHRVFHVSLALHAILAILFSFSHSCHPGRKIQGQEFDPHRTGAGVN